MTGGVNFSEPPFTKFHLQYSSITTDIELLLIVLPYCVGSETINKNIFNSFGTRSNTTRAFRGELNTSFLNAAINGQSASIGPPRKERPFNWNTLMPHQLTNPRSATSMSTFLPS